MTQALLTASLIAALMSTTLALTADEIGDLYAANIITIEKINALNKAGTIEVAQIFTALDSQAAQPLSVDELVARNVLKSTILDAN